MNNMAPMRNCPEGCMVDQIRSRVIVTFIYFLFSLIQNLDMKKKTDLKLFQMP